MLFDRRHDQRRWASHDNATLRGIVVPTRQTAAKAVESRRTLRRAQRLDGARLWSGALFALHRSRWRKSKGDGATPHGRLIWLANPAQECQNSSPRCSTAKNRRFEKRLILKDFFVTENRWRRGRDSPPF